jgi:fatty-acyl-CoA synthase
VSEIDISAIPMIARHSRLRADELVLVYEDEPVSYLEFYDQVRRLAAEFRADGLGPGDRVAYTGLNSVSFLVTAYATFWVGAAFVPLNFRLAAPEAHAILQDARPDVIVAEAPHAAGLDPFVETLAVRRLLLVDSDAHVVADAVPSTRWEALSAFAVEHDESPPHQPLHFDDVAVLLYTSGTTGRPKGVILTHGNLWWNWVNVDSVVDTRVGDISLAVAPLFHIGGLNALTLRTMTRGGTVVVRRSFDPAVALDDLVRYRVNSMFLVPAMLAAIQRQPGFEQADLSQLRSTIVAGAPVPPALISEYAAKGVLLQQAWGLTETSPFSTYLESAKTSDKLGSCGVPMPYTSVRVVDPTTLTDVDRAGATGEFWVRGPNVSRGYWNNPEATEAAFTPDGWFRTGDLGYLDADGYLYIVDRLKDMIITGGENVYPAEIENALNALPRIADAAVIGVADPTWGETVCAVVQLHDGEITLDALRDRLASSIARYKLPRRLVVLDAIPRNGAGKLDKPVIRALVAELDAAQTAAVDAAPFTEGLQVPIKKR